MALLVSGAQILSNEHPVAVREVAVVDLLRSVVELVTISVNLASPEVSCTLLE